MILNELYGALPYPKGISKRKLAQLENDRIYSDTVISLINQALESFEWEGLPPTCNVRFFEYNLLFRAQGIFALENDSIISIGSANGGNINIYREPTNAFGYGANGFNKEYQLYIEGADDASILSKGINKTSGSYNAVLCRDNKMMYPYINYILDYGKRLADLQRAMDVLAQNLKQPVIIQCADDQVESVKKALNQKDENLAAVIASGRSLENINAFKVWPTQVQASTLTELKQYYEWLYAKIQNILGINSNPNPDKMERLLVDEVNSNNQMTDSLNESRLAEREDFCKRVNKAFGLNISVKSKADKFEVSNKEVEEDEHTSGTDSEER